ncbi:Retrovirus-related Pol polyprotein from transposon TNT 1-94 [Senna tora]|uniref:Retrovirus-related Pol polyprotein from transposon TNT 1-94 n=1 Tax=Senna tora TaxID=362788 RepID=A0A834XDW4_9FABA|nr:Retrovirus-related Pol polyprotein from transposon TNT 1-94 [Senna tora]
MGDDQNSSSSNNKSGGVIDSDKNFGSVMAEINYRRDPMYLHPSDTSGLKLIPHQLSEDNYMIWRCAMMIALKTKNKLGFVDGSVKQPVDRSSDAFLSWSFVDSAELEEKYGQTNRPQLLQVKKQMAVLEREFYESDYVDQFLMGLGEAYENVVDNILLMEPVPSFNKVYAMVKRVEQQRTISSTNTMESSALLARVTNQKTVNTNSVNPGFRNFDRKKEKAKLYCTYCNRTGHTEDGLFGEESVGQKQKTGEEDKITMSEIIQEELRKMMKVKPSSSGAIGGDTPLNASYFVDFAGTTHCDYFNSNQSRIKWIIDLGAFSHVTGNCSLLKDVVEPSIKNRVQLPDGIVKTVKLMGKVVLTKGLVLPNVLFVPDFKYNLISVSKLVLDTGLQVIFYKDGCVVQDPLTKKKIAVGKIVKNLYLLEKVFDDFLVCKAVETGGVQADLMHEKLGHPSDGALSHIVGHNNLCNKTCDTCHLAKQSRLSFPTSQTSTETCFELLHVDIWGPYSISSLVGARFMLTIVDDYSRGVWVFLMQSKSQVVNLLGNFFNYVENHFETSVKTMRTDNVMEFLKEAELKDLVRAEGSSRSQDEEKEVEVEDDTEENGLHRDVVEGIDETENVTDIVPTQSTNKQLDAVRSNVRDRKQTG